MAMAPVAAVHDSMSRDDDIKPVTGTLDAVAKCFNLQPLTYNTPTIVKDQVPGAIMMGPYEAPRHGEEIIGYELYYDRDCGGPFACNVNGMKWVDACFDTCCYPCALGPCGLAMILGGVGACGPCFFKKYQRMNQRPVYGKKGTDITKLIPHSSHLYVEGALEHKD